LNRVNFVIHRSAKRIGNNAQCQKLIIILPVTAIFGNTVRRQALTLI